VDVPEEGVDKLAGDRIPEHCIRQHGVDASGPQLLLPDGHQPTVPGGLVAPGVPGHRLVHGPEQQVEQGLNGEWKD